MSLTKQQRFGPGPYIAWQDYWGDGDDPGETFLLVAWASGADHYRAATVDDLRLAGFVPARELDALRKRNEKLERVAEAARLAHVAQATLDLEKLLEAEEALDKALSDLDKEEQA